MPEPDEEEEVVPWCYSDEGCPFGDDDVINCDEYCGLMHRNAQDKE